MPIETLPNPVGFSVNTESAIGFLQSPLAFTLIFFGAIILGFVILLLVLRSFLHKNKNLFTAFKNVILVVQMPKSGNEEGSKQQADTTQQVQEKIAHMETFFSTIGGMKMQKGFKAWLFGREDIFSFEIVLNKELISFHIAVPEYLSSYMQEQLQAQFSSAQIEQVADYNIFNPKGVIFGTYLTFKRPYYFPIKTYKKIESDPLNAITNTLSQLDANAGAAIQFMVRSAPGSWHSMGTKVSQEMHQGKKLEEATKKAKGGLFYGVAKLAKPKSKDEAGAPPKEYKLSALEEDMAKGMEEKTSKAGMEVNIRLIVSAENEVKAKSYLDNIVNSFTQYNIYQYGNSLVRSGDRLNRLAHDFIYRNFNSRRKILLNSEEMASVFHFPLPSTETPKIDWLLFKRAPAPINMPLEGIILGKNIYRGRETVVRMKTKDRQRHMYIIGQTGVGKSWLMGNLIIQDIKNGCGVGVIDPHGELANGVLPYIPKERAEDVIYFDPSDIERPMGLNMLEYHSPEQKTFVINEILAIFDKLYDLKSTGGPMFEQYMRNAMLLVMDDPESGSTLMEIPKVLADEDFRKYKLSKSKNQSVRDFWMKEAEKAGGEASLANMVPYITSKLTQFISNDIMRPIIAQQNSAFNIREVMDNKKILLMNMSKGKIGDMNSNLLGMILIGKLLMAALGRTEIPEEERKDFYLYIDEFQNYLTDSISIILSEARKYKLDLIIGHQYIGQLVKNNDTSIRDAIFGNVGTTIAFRIGVDDAELLAKQFAPVFSEYDVVNVAKSNAYAKILIDNANPPAFNITTLDRAPGNPKIAEAIKQLSRLKYGRDREIVEAEIKERVTMAPSLLDEEMGLK